MIFLHILQFLIFLWFHTWKAEVNYTWEICLRCYKLNQKVRYISNFFLNSRAIFVTICMHCTWSVDYFRATWKSNFQNGLKISSVSSCNTKIARYSISWVSIVGPWNSSILFRWFNRKFKVSRIESLILHHA